MNKKAVLVTRIKSWMWRVCFASHSLKKLCVIFFIHQNSDGLGRTTNGVQMSAKRPVQAFYFHTFFPAQSARGRNVFLMLLSAAA